MRKATQKMRLSLVFTIVLMLAAGAAVAVGLTYSAQFSATQAARQALMAQRGLTQDMVRMFTHERTTEQDGKTVTTYSAPGQTTFSDGEAMGTYTVTRDAGGQTTVSWSHDDVDPATWQNADVTSAIWGPPQLQQVLDRYAAYRAWWERNPEVWTLPLEEQEPLFAELWEAIAPLKTREGPIDPAIANREEEATAPEPPAEGAAAATELAKRVLYRRYALTDEMLTLFTIDAWQEEDVWRVECAPIEIQRLDDVSDWRWYGRLREALGTYSVTLNAGAAQSVAWSLDGAEDDAAYTQANWGQAKAYSARILPWVLTLLKQNEPIIAKYPEEQHDAFSVEDAAAYDQAFRDAGFTNPIYCHALPKEGELTAEQALALAKQAFMSEYGLSQEQIDGYWITTEYLQLTEESKLAFDSGAASWQLDGGGLWVFYFHDSEAISRVYLRATDGEVQELKMESGTDGNG